MLGCDLIDIYVSDADKIIIAPLGELYVTWTGQADTDSVNELTESDDDQ